MKKIVMGLLTVFILMFLVACGGSKTVEPDYTQEGLEKAVNEGKDVAGKTVKIKVLKLISDGPAGYKIQAGEHLIFMSNSNPKVKDGNQIIVKIVDVLNLQDSFFITYEKM